MFWACGRGVVLVVVMDSSGKGSGGVALVERGKSEMAMVGGSSVGRGLKVEKSSSESKFGVVGVVSESLTVVIVVAVVVSVVEVTRGVVVCGVEETLLGISSSPYAARKKQYPINTNAIIKKFC